MTAALLQRFAVEAAAYLPAWEIIDTASAGKRDAPSGMARELAWRLSQVRSPETEIPVDETVGAIDARGADIDGSRSPFGAPARLHDRSRGALRPGR